MVLANKFARVIAGVALVSCGAAVAAGGAGSADDDWAEARSLRELPAGVQVLLGVGEGPDRDGIADREGRFNPTDAIMEPVPRRRFALGAVGSGRVLVALELGGAGYALRAVEFRQVGAMWETERCTRLRALPRHAAELLAAWSAGAGRDGWACERPDAAAVAPTQPPAA